MQIAQHIDNDQLLTTREVCAVAKCSRATLRRWIAAGTFPAGTKVGSGKNGSVRWSRLAIYRHLRLEN